MVPSVKKPIMKIKQIKVIVASPGRNFVTVKVITDQGLYGIGDGTVNGRERSVASYLEDHVIPTLIGKDPMRIEDIWQYLYKGVLAAWADHHGGHRRHRHGVVGYQGQGC